MRRPITIALSLALLAVPELAAAQAPSTDIYVAPLAMTGGQRSLGPIQPVTRRKGYDNQPAFNAAGDALYYTSQRSGHTDIHSVNLRHGASRSMFDATDTDEYSATLTPDRQALSVIRVETDSAQRLWRFPLDGSDPTVLVPAIKPVGYHAWATDSTVLLFVLGQPATLQLANVRTGNARVIASGIGRWLARHPTRAVIGVVRKPAGAAAMVAEFDIATGSLRDIAPVIEGTDDYAWTPEGTLLGAKGAVIHEFNSTSRQWVAIADLSSQGITTITRLVVNRQGTDLAFVANER
jgi:hypothetical protein